MENRSEDIWFVDGSSDTLGVPISGTEVADWKWVSRAELEQMAGQGDFFRYSYLNDILTQGQ
jgi:hypothetical protein